MIFDWAAFYWLPFHAEAHTAFVWSYGGVAASGTVTTSGKQFIGEIQQISTGAIMNTSMGQS